MGRKIQLIFQACGLLMLVLLVLRARSGEWTTLNYLMLAVSGACCLLVFVRFLYVFNYSYALAAMLNGLLLTVARPSAVTALLGGAAILYGARLFWFSWARQHGESYAPRMANVIKADEAMPKPVKVALWVNCTLLMTFHLMAVYFASANPVLSFGVALGGMSMIAGTIIEGLADWQKQRVKNVTPDQPVLHGLFRHVRHPNYLGEILLQAGLITVGLSVVSTFSELLAIVLAPGYIILLMISESKRVDTTQETTYWDHPDYPAWRARTGSLVPRFTRGSPPPGAT
jgi:steroid 5-alpha reductase family enzyme